MTEELNETEEETKPTTQPEQEAPADDLITQANAAAIRQEKANEVLKEQLDRQEQMQAKAIIGGTAEAGKPSEPKEETPEEYAKKVMANDIKEE